MQKYLSLIIGSLMLLAPALASAANITVYPLVMTAYGNNHPSMINPSAKDITVCVFVSGNKQCDVGVPTFSIPNGSDYTVLFQPPTGYTYTTDSNCAGVAQGDIQCTVSYVDGTADQLTHDRIKYTALPLGPFSGPTPTPGQVASNQAVISCATCAPVLPTQPTISASTVVLPNGKIGTQQDLADYNAQVAALEAEIIQLLQQIRTLLIARMTALSAGNL